MSLPSRFDSILLVSFGGPEKPDEVMPFLENVVKGRNVPRERLEEVAEHYYEFGGKSPINDQNREIIKELSKELHSRGIELPIYFGNRNWNPFIEEALLEMKKDGRINALAFFTSMFSCYSGCRQYRENIHNAQAKIENPPQVQKLRFAFNHPKFILAYKELIQDALTNEKSEGAPHIIFTAHSIPSAMAGGCSYEVQLNEAARLIADGREYTVCYQSRSGSPHVPWLEPDVLDVIKELAEKGIKELLISPIGFVSDHMEVLYDLDVEAKELANELNIKLIRSKTASNHPLFISMIADLIEERLGLKNSKDSIGNLPAWHDVCPEQCCLPGR